MNNIIIRFLGFLLFFCFSLQSYAQTFSVETKRADEALDLRPAGISANSAESEPRVIKTDETIEQITKAFATKKVQAEVKAADNPLQDIANALNEKKNTKSADENEEANSDEEDVFIPEGELYRLNTPTKDGSARGGQAFVEVDSKGRMKKSTNIFLFYDKFKMINTSAKIPTCNVRFNIVSNLDRKINQLDIKLVWPGLTTTLSFSNVLPNTQTFYDYALISKGCYNMDKAPNIIVNRCRVKGMTASECANKLTWLSK